MADQELDVRGHRCPIPVMRAAKLMLAMKKGETLRVIATDPAAVPDFEAYIRGSGNQLIESTKTERGELIFVLKRV